MADNSLPRTVPGTGVVGTLRAGSGGRAFKPGVQDLLEQGMRRLSEGIAAAHGCSVSIRYERRYPALVNHAAEAGCMLHNPRYDFNDAILTLGASYWSRLVEHCLPEGN